MEGMEGAAGEGGVRTGLLFTNISLFSLSFSFMPSQLSPPRFASYICVYLEKDCTLETLVTVKKLFTPRLIRDETKRVGNKYFFFLWGMKPRNARKRVTSFFPFLSCFQPDERALPQSHHLLSSSH